MPAASAAITKPDMRSLRGIGAGLLARLGMGLIPV
jgi:hypothetical protein